MRDHLSATRKRAIQYSDPESMYEAFQRHWVHVLLASAVAFVVLVALSVYVIIKRRRKAASPLTPEEPKQATLQCPPVRIDFATSQQQPAVRSLPITPEPVRIKARGLLERRGSSASLTIDLNPDSSFVLGSGSPPKECSAEEYLVSAGNRMTRKQLRSCLKNVHVLHQEFLEIPLNHPHKLDLPGCSNKNRYKNMWPNERTRIVLRKLEPDAEHFINANYVRGYDGEPSAFIATQGPLPNTVDDFWEMAWQERAPAIVMMTKLKEKNKTKCEPYLPSRCSTYGDLEVTVLITTPKNGYYVRDLLLRKGTDVRQLRHYWFTGWPDHKAPSSTARQLLDLANDVHNHTQAQRQRCQHVGPVIVHCSAGIGRTGCFIALSIGMRQLLEEHMVDVLGIVCQMRLDRGGLIQTCEQYEFVHHALLLYEASLPHTPTQALPLTSSSSSNSSSHTSPTASAPFL